MGIRCGFVQAVLNSWVHLRDRNAAGRLINSLEHLAKLNYVQPFWDDRLNLGLDAQYVSSRLARTGASRRGYPVFNLTLTSTKAFEQSLLRGLELSASLYNLFDEDYASVSGDEHVMTVIPQNGRNLRILATLRF